MGGNKGDIACFTIIGTIAAIIAGVVWLIKGGWQ